MDDTGWQGATVAVVAITFLVTGLLSAVISAVYGYSLVWALVALSAGGAVCMIMYWVASIRTPDDLD